MRDWILDELLEVDPALFKAVRERFVLDTIPPRRPLPGPEPVCLTCPPWEALEQHVLGGIAAASIKLHAPMVQRYTQQRLVEFDLADKADAEAIGKGVRAGLASFEQALQRDLKAMKPMLATLKAAATD